MTNFPFFLVAVIQQSANNILERRAREERGDHWRSGDGFGDAVLGNEGGKEFRVEFAHDVIRNAIS